MEIPELPRLRRRLELSVERIKEKHKNKTIPSFLRSSMAETPIPPPTPNPATAYSDDKSTVTVTATAIPNGAPGWVSILDSPALVFSVSPPIPSPAPSLERLGLSRVWGLVMKLWCGSGLFKKKGFKGSFADAGTSDKLLLVTDICSFECCSQHGSFLLKKLRGKDDGVAGCCTGIALNFPVLNAFSFSVSRFLKLEHVGYQEMAYPCLGVLSFFSFRAFLSTSGSTQSCLTFGAFSFIMEGLNKRHPALAPSSSLQGSHSQVDALPSLAIHLPNELKAHFSSFYDSLKKFEKRSF
ncbi:Chloroplastic import inner membrane translocase subunit TIM22-2-like protein [Drosera capensis]